MAAFESVLVQVGPFQVGLPLSQVVEALQMVALDPLPAAPAHCLGCFDFHGTQVAVLELSRRLGISAAPRPAHQRSLVVIQCDGGLLALAVDQVLYLGTAELPPPSFLPTQTATRALLKGFVLRAGIRIPVLDGNVVAREGAWAQARPLFPLPPGNP